MEFTNHAIRRINQRGISRDSINVIWKYGRESFAHSGAQRYFFGKKECHDAISEFKKMIQLLERTKDGTMVVANGKIVTVYKN